MKMAFVLLFTGLIFSCSQKRNGRILSQNEMKSVMYDMTRTTEFVNSFILARHPELDRETTLNTWYNEVFKLHKISKNDFDASYSYYKNHTALMKAILDSVAAIPTPVIPPPTLKKDTVVAKVDSTKAKTDSLKIKNGKIDSILKRKTIRKDLHME